MSPRFPRGLMLVLVAICATGACGLDSNDRPEVLAPGELPEGILEEPTTTAPPESGGVVVDVFVVDADQESVVLAPLERTVADASDVKQRLDVLLAEPPSEDEQDQGLASQIPAETTVLDVAFERDDDDDVIVIDLSTGLTAVQGEAQRAALAQLVYTATEREDLQDASVRFEIEGEPTDALDGEGNEKETVTRRDYRELEPEE
jgi:spore germination protein GerM